MESISRPCDGVLFYRLEIVMGNPIDVTIATDWATLQSSIEGWERLVAGECDLSVRVGGRRGVIRTAQDDVYQIIVETGEEPLETCVRDGRSGGRAYAAREGFQRAINKLIHGGRIIAAGAYLPPTEN
jgi:hypothetical protein